MIEGELLKKLHSCQPGTKEHKATLKLLGLLKQLEGEGWQDLASPAQAATRERFSGETQALLEKQGSVVVRLPKKTIAQIYQEQEQHGRQECWNAFRNHPHIWKSSSIDTQVAFNPHDPFIDESKNKTWEKQQEMLQRYAENLRKSVPGTNVIVGSPADYFGITYAYYGQVDYYASYETRMLSKDWIRTTALLYGNPDNPNYRSNYPLRLVVGKFCPTSGFELQAEHDSWNWKEIGILPLIIPAKQP